MRSSSARPATATMAGDQAGSVDRRISATKSSRGGEDRRVATEQASSWIRPTFSKNLDSVCCSRCAGECFAHRTARRRSGQAADPGRRADVEVVGEASPPARSMPFRRVQLAAELDGVLWRERGRVLDAGDLGVVAHHVDGVSLNVGHCQAGDPLPPCSVRETVVSAGQRRPLETIRPDASISLRRRRSSRDDSVPGICRVLDGSRLDLLSDNGCRAARKFVEAVEPLPVGALERTA